VSNARLQQSREQRSRDIPFSGWANFSHYHPVIRTYLLDFHCDTVIEESPKLGYHPGPDPAMPSNPSVRLTKKQRKATAFRERGKKSKGVPHEDTGRPNPAPGRPRRRPSTGDNGEGHNHHDEDYCEDDEDANAVPTMENQDQALAEMAGDTEAVSKKPDGGRPVRVQKAAVAADSAAAQKKKDRDRDKKRSRADDGGEARPATKRARLARSSDEIPPPLAREGDGDGDEATGMSVLEDGEGGHGASDAKDKEGKLQRYILFVGMSYPSTITQVSLPVTLVVEGNLKYTTTREAIQNHFSQCGAVSPPPSFWRPTNPQHRPTPGSAPAHTQGHPCWRDSDQVQRLRVPRILDAVRAANRPALAPVRT